MFQQQAVKQFKKEFPVIKNTKLGISKVQWIKANKAAYNHIIVIIFPDYIITKHYDSEIMNSAEFKHQSIDAAECWIKHQLHHTE